METIIGYAEAWRWWWVEVDNNDFAPDHKLALHSFRHPYPVEFLDSEEKSAVCLCRGSQSLKENYGKSLLPTSVSPMKWEPAWAAWDHRCGFYGYKLNHLQRVGVYRITTNIYSMHYPYHHIQLQPKCTRTCRKPILGRVALYGTVVEHEKGYRAEKMRILDVWVPYDTRGIFQCSPLIKGIFQPFHEVEGNAWRLCLELTPFNQSASSVIPLGFESTSSVGFEIQCKHFGVDSGIGFILRLYEIYRISFNLSREQTLRKLEPEFELLKSNSHCKLSDSTICEVLEILDRYIVECGLSMRMGHMRALLDLLGKDFHSVSKLKVCNNG
jgi:hypothetical protein